MREKATIDHLAQNFDKPKPHGEKNTLRSPTTATGLSVEDRVRKEWYDRFVRNPARIVPRMEMPSVQIPVRGVLGSKLDDQLSALA